MPESLKYPESEMPTTEEQASWLQPSAKPGM